jgi:hypothetical protein
MVTKYIAGVLARPGLERLNDWANIGPVQKAALDEFAGLIVLGCINCYSPDDSADDWADKMRRMMEP